MSIPQRKLGKHGPLVPALGLGCMSMSTNATYGAMDVEESTKVLEKAVKSGVTFWDTANAYVGNEEFLSKTVSANRDKVFICTKVGFDHTSPNYLNGKKEHVREQCELSLKKLKVDVIDLYYLHRLDPNTPIEETIGEMSKLVKEGKVRYLGLSECSSETIRRAYAVHPIAALQVEYSPWETGIETNGVLATCRELGVAIVAYSPLGKGFLTGQIKTPDDFEESDFRKSIPRFQGENFYKNLDLVKEIEKLAKKKGVATGQLALAWVMGQGEDFIVIPGTKRVKYFDENLGAANLHLTKEENDAVRKLVDSANVAGERLPSYMMNMVDK